MQINADEQLRVAPESWPATPVSVDAQRKHLWLNGAASNGARVYDLGVSKTDPPQIAQYQAIFTTDSHIVKSCAGSLT